jgi:hypothetical protein
VRGQMSVNAITGGQQAGDGRREVAISHACIFRVWLQSSLDCTSAVTMLLLDPFFYCAPLNF